MSGTITRGKVLRGDMALFDGKTSTATRPDATGGTTTGLTVADTVDVLQVFGAGTHRTRATIESAIRRAGASNVTFQYGLGQWTIDDDVTIPANVASRIPSGTTFSVSSGKTLTFDGPVFPDSADIGAGDGDVVFSGSSTQIIGITQAESDAGVTPVNYQYPEGHVYRYGTNTTPGTTDMADAINNAILSLAQHAHGGQVQLPAEICRIASTINAAENVSLVGYRGQSSRILADGCDGITIGFTSYYDKTCFRDFEIVGTNSSTHYGIRATGTLDNDDQTYGIVITRALIRNFNVGISFRTVWHSTIQDCRIEDVDRGIELVGENVGLHISFNKIIHTGGGGGSGTIAGIYLDAFDYTAGAGSQPPEGVQIHNNIVYGFPTAIKIVLANFVNISFNDLYGSIYGIYATTVNLAFNVIGNYFDMNGTGVIAGIQLAAVLTPSSAQTVISGNGMTGTSTSTAVGVKVNDSSNGGQSYIVIDKNYFTGFTSNDILVDHAGVTYITSNTCASSSPTNSISVPDVLSGTVYIDRNHCAKVINWDAALAAAGSIVVGVNTVSGTTKQYGTQQIPQVASAGTIALGLGAKVFTITGNTSITSITATGWSGRRVTLIFGGSLTFTDGSNLVLAGNFSTAANSTITLVCSGSSWYEVSRSAN